MKTIKPSVVVKNLERKDQVEKKQAKIMQNSDFKNDVSLKIEHQTNIRPSASMSRAWGKHGCRCD